MGQKLLLILTLYISGFLAVAESMDQMGNTFGMGQGGYSGMGSGDGFGGSAGSDVPDSFKDIVNRTQGSSMGSSPDSSMGSFSAAQKPQAKIGDGFYVVAMAGKMLGVANQFAQYVPSVGEYAYGKTQFALNGAAGYIGAGYGMQFNGVYVGLEGFVGKILNRNHSYYQFATPTWSYSGRQAITIGFQYAAASRLGYYISPVALLYGKLGISHNRFETKGDNGDPVVFQSDTQMTNLRGHQWGGGLEVAMTKHLSARIETYQTIYKKFTLDGLNSGIVDRSSRYKLRAQEMLLGIAVKPSSLGGPMENSQYEEIPSGIYVGVEGGVSGTDFYRNVFGQEDVGSATPVPMRYEANSASIKPAWGIYGGYADTLGRFYVAGEFQLESNKSKVIESRKPKNRPTVENSNDALGISMALSAKLGYVFDNGTVGYGRIGVVRSKLTHRYVDSTDSSSSFESIGLLAPYNKVLNGLRVGGGIEIALNQAMRLRGDYTLDIYPGISFPGQVAQISPTRQKIKVTRNEVKLGLAYTLPPLY